MINDIPQLTKQTGTALVLSGGATKAFYFHLGVLKVFQQEEITSIVGTSAGAVMGGFIASGATVDSLLVSLHQRKVYMPKFEKWVKTLTSTMLFRPRYVDLTIQSVYTSFRTLEFLLSLPWLAHRDIVAEAIDRFIRSQTKVSGFFDAVALENLFKSMLPSADFSDMDVDLYVIATALDEAKRGIFNSRYAFETELDIFMNDVPIHKAVRASSAIPGMFEPVLINGRYYVDGEIRRTLSADVGVQLADRVVISHPYQPLELGAGRSVRDMGWVNILKQSGMILFRERINVWKRLYAKEFPEKRILWIEPDPEDMDFFLAPEFTFRTSVQRKLIASGERAALRALEQEQGYNTQQSRTPKKERIVADYD